MGDKYQENWIFYLPWALLGLRSSYNKDLGTSPMEMTIGKHGQLPGTILTDPDEAESFDDINIDAIIKKLQIKDRRVVIPPSINRPNPAVDPLPDRVTHVYAKQHNIKGLACKYLGPFPVTARPSRSTIQIKVGLNKDGSDRSEIRHVSDIKVAYLRDDAVLAERPKRGRPPKKAEDTEDTVNENITTSVDSSPALTNVNIGKKTNKASLNLDPQPHRYNLRERKTLKEVATIDFTRPPPNWTARENSNQTSTYAEPQPTTGPPPYRGFLQRGAWRATSEELATINASINIRGVS